MVLYNGVVDGAAHAAGLRCRWLALSVALFISWLVFMFVVDGVAHQLACALMVVLPMVHAASLHTPLLTALRCCQLALSCWRCRLRCSSAGWCSHAGVVDGAAGALALA